MSAGVALPVGCVDISIRMATWSSHGVLLSLLFAERFATQLDAMGVVDDTIQDRVGESRVIDQVVPAVHRDLAGNQRCATTVAIQCRATGVRLLPGSRRQADSGINAVLEDQLATKHLLMCEFAVFFVEVSSE